MPDGVLSVRVTPRSRQNKVEVVDGQVRVWVTASPTDGQANDAVCRLLAKALDLAPSKVTIRRGHTSRDKQVALEGVGAEEGIARLLDC